MDDILEKIEKVDYYIRWLSRNLSPGKWKSNTLGFSLEFEKISEYVPGDDIRGINWKASSRSDRTLKNDYLSTKNINVFLVVDNSKSMMFGSKSRTKNYISAEVAAVIAYSANKFGDNVGLITWPNFEYVQPKNRDDYFLFIAEKILEEKETDPYSLKEVFDNIPRTRSLIFILSDFWDIDLSQLNLFLNIHDIVPIIIEDRMELELPEDVFFVKLRDLESKKCTTSLLGRDLREYKQKVEKERLKILSYFEKKNLSYGQIKENYLPEEITDIFLERKHYV